MATTQTVKRSPSSSAPDARTLERMLYYLKLTRESEYRIERVLYRQGKIVGGVYVGRGQEAIGVGSAIQLIEGDVALPSHRDFSSFVIRGVSLRQIISNWMARANGPTRGRENTLHIGDLKLGLIPIISPLGDTCPRACGVALTFKQRRKKNVALVHFREGTTSRGDVHEAMGDPIARLEKLMLARRLVTREGIHEMERAIQKEIYDAVAFAESSPMPEGETAVEGVYCEPDCWWKRKLSHGAIESLSH